MDHATFLSLREDTEEAREHLAGCASCQAVLARWDSAWPAPDLAPAVLSELGGPRWSWAWVPAAAAALLVVTAFWAPERRWLEKDPGDAAWEASAGRVQGGWR